MNRKNGNNGNVYLYVILCCIFGFSIAGSTIMVDNQNKIDIVIENQNTIMNMQLDNMKSVMKLHAQVDELKDALANVNTIFGLVEVKGNITDKKAKMPKK
jgi:hypothetical protein